MAPSLSGATLLCHFSRAFPYPQLGDVGGCCSAPVGQLSLTASQLTTTATQEEEEEGWQCCQPMAVKLK